MFFSSTMMMGPEEEMAKEREVTTFLSKLTDIRDGNLWIVVIVKSCFNQQAGSWLAAQEWTTNQKQGQQVDPTLDNDYNS